MGERSATKPAQRQYGKLAARHLPMLRLELPDSRVSQSHQRRLGNPFIIDRYGQWVASSFNDLPPQRAATIAQRSAERRVGKECVSTCTSRWSPIPSKKN